MGGKVTYRDFEMVKFLLLDSNGKAIIAILSSFDHSYEILWLGGLLVCMAACDAKGYCNELEKIDGRKAWIIGDVIKGPREAKLSENFDVIEV